MTQIPWDKLIKQGIFAALFIILLVYVMNQNQIRENKYQDTIKQVVTANDKYADIIKVELAEIKGELR